MRALDHLNLSGQLLDLLVAVFEEGSVTRAAHRLGVTQSAVSHLLDKLRTILGDPLFVRSGRGIVATARAEALVPRARLLLDELRGFASASGFDPATLVTTVTIAASDLQRDLLVPALLRRCRQQTPGLSLRVIPSDVPTAEMLRSGHCQLVISPRPPDAPDVLQKRLFEDHYQVFYDAAQRQAPRTLDDYLAAEHVTVVYEPRRALDLDRLLAERGVQRRFVATVPGFAGLPALLRGSTLLATAPGLLRTELLRNLASVDPPLPCPPMPMYLIWHLRHQSDPLHRWLRQEILASVPSVPPATMAQVQSAGMPSTTTSPAAAARARAGARRRSRKP